MKHLKKIAGLLLAVVMMFVMSVTAMADTTYTITIDNTVAGHTYKAYQVFSGKITTETVNGTTESTLSDINWGSNVNGPDLLIKLKESEAQGGLGNIFGSTVVNAKDVAEALTKANPDANTMKKFAKIVNGCLTGNGTSSNPITNNSSKILNYQISGLAAGYYLVKDTDPSGNIKLDAYTNYILKVAGDVKVEPKSEVPSSEKKVQDKNDTEKTTTGWIDSADYDIGDDVPFKLTGTVAKNYGDFTGVYEFNFVDNQSAGLDEPKNFVAKVVQGKTKTVIKTGYTVSTKDQNNKFTGVFSVNFPNLKELKDENDNIIAVKAGDKIEVTYTSKLNDNAVIGSGGNPNTMHLEYSNNPNGTQKGQTKDDTVIVFTYKTVINKTDKDGKALKGAKFALYKLTKGGDTVVYTDNNGNEVKGTWGEPLDYVEKDDADTTRFTFKGLDDGIYKLSETKTPDKFNSIDDIVFEVVATHEENSDVPKLTTLSGEKLSGEISFSKDKNNQDALTASVVNYAGSQLPETGGIGTTIFYVVGVVLMLGAGVLLITKRRMSAKH